MWYSGSGSMKTIIFSFLLFLLTVQGVDAAKLLPQARKGITTTSQKVGASSALTVSPKLRGDRKALNVYFNNLQAARSVSYTLYYATNGQQEGAGGTISTSGNSANRELLFGTCSKNVCRYHANITNMKLEVTYTTSSGKKFLKRYRIKI